MKAFVILFFSSASLFSQPTFTISVNTYQPECALAAAAIHVSGGRPPYYFHWSNGALGDTLSSLNAGIYTVIISDSDTTTRDTTTAVNISAYPCGIVANNVFTPNGDGVNDHWSIGRTEYYPDFMLQVFDRWGQLVHTQRHQYTPWDGTQIGLKVPEATYYFVFFYDETNSKNIEKGSVTIIR